MKYIFLLALYILLFKVGNSQIKYASLNHIAIDVTDLNRSYQFYKNVIELDSIADPFHDKRHIWFKIGEHAQLHLIEVKDETSIHYKGTHNCFTVVSIEEVTRKLDMLKIHYENWLGKSNEYTIRPDGVKQIYFQDPDGYWIEVNNDKY